MLKDKVCVVTGAARGIGRGTAIEMARRGARVVAADRDLAEASDIVRTIKAAGGDGLAVECDISHSAEVEAALQRAAERFGGIDVLHNNAGVTESNLHGPSTVETLPDEIFEQVLTVNLLGTWRATRAALPYLKRSERSPAIINASSVGGLHAAPHSAAYGATKAAIINLTRSMAMDFAPFGIRCNCYCPGSIETPMLDGFLRSAGSTAAALSRLTATQLIDRVGQPRDVANLVCFLASDDASFMTGAIITLDGGSSAWRGARPH